MQPAPFLAQDALVGCLLGQGVLEDVLQFGNLLLLLYQFHALQLGQFLRQIVVFFKHGAQDPVQKGAADNRRPAHHPFELLIQPVDTSQDQGLDSIRYRHSLNSPRGPPAAAGRILFYGAGLDQVAYNLFQEKGVAIGLIDHHLPHVGRQAVNIQQIVHQFDAVDSS